MSCFIIYFIQGNQSHPKGSCQLVKILSQITEQKCGLITEVYIIKYPITLYHTIPTLPYPTLPYRTVPHSTTQHRTAQHSTVQYSTIRYRHYSYKERLTKRNLLTLKYRDMRDLICLFKCKLDHYNIQSNLY